MSTALPPKRQRGVGRPGLGRPGWEEPSGRRGCGLARLCLPSRTLRFYTEDGGLTRSPTPLLEVSGPLQGHLPELTQAWKSAVSKEFHVRELNQGNILKNHT